MVWATHPLTHSFGHWLCKSRRNRFPSSASRYTKPKMAASACRLPPPAASAPRARQHASGLCGLLPVSRPQDAGRLRFARRRCRFPPARPFLARLPTMVRIKRSGLRTAVTPPPVSDTGALYAPADGTPAGARGLLLAPRSGGPHLSPPPRRLLMGTAEGLGVHVDAVLGFPNDGRMIDRTDLFECAVLQTSAWIRGGRSSGPSESDTTSTIGAKSSKKLRRCDLSPVVSVAHRAHR